MPDKKVSALRKDLRDLAEKYSTQLSSLEIAGNIATFGVILLMYNAPSKESGREAIKMCVKQGLKFDQENGR